MRCLITWLLWLGIAATAAAASNPAIELATRLLAQARQAAEQADYAAAMQLSERVADLDAAPAPLRGRAQLLLAWLRAENGQAEIAAGHFAAAAANASLSASERHQARIGAASLLLSLGQAEAALAQLRQDNEDPQEQALRGRALLRLQRHQAAADALLAAIRSQTRLDQPVEPVWRSEAVTALLAIRQWAPAAAQLRSLLRDDAANADWWRLLGDTLLQQKLPAQAAAAWQTALQTGMDDPRHRRDLARLYLSLDLPSQAHASIAAAMVDADDHALAAEALYRMRQAEMALAHWRSAYALSAKVEYLLNLARLLSELERWREADAAWQELSRSATQIGDNDRLLAAISAFRNDRREAAIVQLAALRQGSALATTAQQWLEYLNALDR